MDMVNDSVKDLLKKLKRVCKNNSLKLPAGIDFDYDETKKTLKMKMKNGIKQNMQEDCSAFEGWALGFKANLENSIERVELDWDEQYEPLKEGEEWRHFNRFLYRVDKFQELYDWFTVPNPHKSWNDQKNAGNWQQLVLNKPGLRKETTEDNGLRKTEHDMEGFFTTPEGSAKLKQAVNNFYKIDLNEIKNQFPVGVFDSEVIKGTYIFTGGKSAIDLYSIGQDHSFNIFELKIEQNVKVGIVSELFFYASLIKDVIDNNIKYELTDLVDISKLDKVNAFFLTPRLHPMITDSVIKRLNACTGIAYMKLLYKINDIELNVV